jgi:hypothetical protein
LTFANRIRSLARGAIDQSRLNRRNPNLPTPMRRHLLGLFAPHALAASKGRGCSITTRCTVPVPMPSVLPIFNMPDYQAPMTGSPL